MFGHASNPLIFYVTDMIMSTIPFIFLFKQFITLLDSFDFLCTAFWSVYYYSILLLVVGKKNKKIKIKDPMEHRNIMAYLMWFVIW